MTKSVQDLADLLDVLVDPSQTTVPDGGYRSAVTGSWGDIRIGVLEPEKWLFSHKIVKLEKEANDQMVSIIVVPQIHDQSSSIASATRVEGCVRKAQESCQSREACHLDIPRGGY